MKTKAQLEQEIIEAAKRIPSTYGEYKIKHSLYREIARIMGYKINEFYYGKWNFKNNEDRQNCTIIINGMEKRGIIKSSKNGMAYKMICD